MDKHLAELEAELAQVLRDGAWAESASLLLSITGIGVVTTAWLLVGTLNFQGCASAASASAYVGLVPLEHESGSSVRNRAQIGHGGNARLRTALYLATLTAARFNPVIKAHYQRLRAAGKPNKVARCAAARKLLDLAWAVVTKRQPFDPAYGMRIAEERQMAYLGHWNGRAGGRSAPAEPTPDPSCPQPSGTAVGVCLMSGRWYGSLWAGRIRSPEAQWDSRSNSCLTSITVSYFVGRFSTPFSPDLSR